MAELKLSLVIPTFNMANDLPPLLDSLHLALQTAGELAAQIEIVFVNDGSIDATASVLSAWIADDHFGAQAQLQDIEKNVGRFLARQKGANAASAANLVLIDTRIEIPSSFFLDVLRALRSHSCLQGRVLIKTHESSFNLYWQLSHQIIFKRHFRDIEDGFFLTPDNFSQYVVGTTIFVCPTQIFKQVCSSFSSAPLNDDSHLIERICKITPIWVTSEVAVYWRPRQDLRSFLARIWERGPSFVEYHLFNRQSRFRVFAWLAILALLINISLFFYSPIFFFKILLWQAMLATGSALLLTREPKQFFRIAPLQLLVIVVSVLAIARGFVLQTAGRITREI